MSQAPTTVTEVRDVLASLESHTLQTREFPTELRATDAAGGRTFHGQAVPFDEQISLWRGFREQIATGAVQGHDGQLWWRHREPIGVLDGAPTETHWEIDATISDTTLGRDAQVLVSDGVVKKLSIGFQPITWTVTEHIDDQGGDYTLITYTEIWIREVSLVPHPAYTNTSISNLREGNTRMTVTAPPAPNTWATTDDLDEVRSGLDKVSRQVQTIAVPQEPTAPTSQWRSAGELLKAIVGGNDQARGEYDAVLARAYTGATTADDVEAPTWAKDLTRLVEGAAGLSGFFATEALPAEGLTVDGVVLKSDTTSNSKQAAEGDDLSIGKIQLETVNWPVETFGGATELTRIMIERSRTNILDKTLRALAIAAGKAKAARFRAFYKTVVDAQLTAGADLDLPLSPTWKQWLVLLIDAVDHFTDQGLSLDGLVVPKNIMAMFVGYEGTDGRPMMTFDGSGSNTVGRLDLSQTKIGGKLANLDIIYNAEGAAAPAFVNAEAIRSYESPIQRLQDGNIINLSQQFSVYHYAALADEIPTGILPVKIATV